MNNNIILISKTTPVQHCIKIPSILCHVLELNKVYFKNFYLKVVENMS